MNLVAVLGSGTMGAGIAQVALGAGFPVLLYDVSDTALERACSSIAAGLAKQGRADATARLRTSSDLEALTGAGLVIEAVPEQLDLKRQLFAQIGARCPAPTILASNTSSLSIGALAAACPQPQRVAGLHFFNPVHRMALVEVVRAHQTDTATIAALLEFVARLGKTAVQARDTPGFIVNRVARPFYGEALRIVGDGLADYAAVDMALQRAGGFPLGPFALMDLIGIDINFAVTRSMFEQSFYEPRYRPHLIQQQMVQSGALGRKAGRGFYDYSQPLPAEDTPTEQPPPVQGAVLIGEGSWGSGLAELCQAAGLRLLEELPYRSTDIMAAFVVAGRAEGAAEQLLILDRQIPPNVPILAQCTDLSACDLAALLNHPERLVGFDSLFIKGALTLVATPLLSDAARAQATALAHALGHTPVWMNDGPGLIVPRVVAMLANEAAFALGEGVADAETIDLAMRLGANHPTGPLARAAALGYAKVVAILDHLYAEYGEERYRVAPALRRAARVGRW